MLVDYCAPLLYHVPENCPGIFAEISMLTYKASGVDYDAMDEFKRACQRAARGTAENLAAHGFKEPPVIRGESAYVIETPEGFLAHVEEALGTKILVADAMLELTGKSFYRNVAIDDVSTIVNDLATCGARPVSVAMYLAVGDAAYLSHPARRDLVDGFAEGCALAGAAWGGGETQVLKGIISPGTAVLGGSAVGRIAPKSRRIAGRVRDGDAIVFLASSGVQTNGLTLCRAVAERLPKGYLTPIGGGRAYGEALLDPSVIAVRFVAACQDAGIDLHYASHLTGHGWRKLMRLDEPFVYRIDFVPEPPPIFPFIVESAGLDPAEAYGTFNMGVSFALYVDAKDADRCVSCAKENGYTAWNAGRVVKDGMRKAVEIKPLGLTYGGETLKIR
jgi:phosphoribosylformylglycinamidine cyclo-ligase